MWEESLGTQAGVHLIEGVRLIRGPLNTGFTVIDSKTVPGGASDHSSTMRTFMTLCLHLVEVLDR